MQVAVERETGRLPGWLRRLARRWPTGLAVAMTAAKFGGGASEEMVTNLAYFVIVLQLNYVVMAQLRRRWVVWLNLPIAAALFLALKAQPWVDPMSVLIALALVALLWGLARPALRRSGTFLAQAVGMVSFGALAVAAVSAGPELALYLTAAGWLAHGVWDFVHLRRDTVVARSFAEWCGVIDILLAAELLLFAASNG